MQLRQKNIQDVIEQVSGIILGKKKEIREVMLVFLANGHILLEDIPGVGKTTLALAFPEQCPWSLNGYSSLRM